MKYLPVFLMILIVLSGLGITFLNNSPNYSYSLDKNDLRHFLESQYIPSIGLLRAATATYPDNITIYISNDNVLAARALAVLGSPLASKVLTILNNNFSGGWNGKIDILLGRDIPDNFYSSYNELVKEDDGYRIVWEKLNTSIIITDWYNYADLLVYHALDRLLWGSRPEAEKSFLNLTKMWDGYGFRDKPTSETGVYAVYKCALFIYLYRALEAAGSNVIYRYRDIYEKCLEIIAKAQDAIKGGIHTDYRIVNGRIIIQGDMNTETTSMVVLALYSNYPVVIGSHAKSSQRLVPGYVYSFGYNILAWTLSFVVFGAVTRFLRKLM